MGRLTVEERITQIIESGIPHIIKPGSRIKSYHNEYTTEDPIYCFVSGVVEVVFGGEYETPFLEENLLIKRYGDQLVAASGGVFNKHDLQEPGLFKYVSRKKVEMHALYNAQSDMTHFFLLPSRVLVAEKQE